MPGMILENRMLGVTARVRKLLRNRLAPNLWPSTRPRCDLVATFPARFAAWAYLDPSEEIQANRSTCRRVVLRRNCARRNLYRQDQSPALRIPVKVQPL